jgi:hypothetical protein
MRCRRSMHSEAEMKTYGSRLVLERSCKSLLTRTDRRKSFWSFNRDNPLFNRLPKSSRSEWIGIFGHGDLHDIYHRFRKAVLSLVLYATLIVVARGSTCATIHLLSTHSARRMAPLQFTVLEPLNEPLKTKMELSRPFEQERCLLHPEMCVSSLHNPSLRNTMVVACTAPPRKSFWPFQTTQQCRFHGSPLLTWLPSFSSEANKVSQQTMLTVPTIWQCSIIEPYRWLIHPRLLFQVSSRSPT